MRGPLDLTFVDFFSAIESAGTLRGFIIKFQEDLLVCVFVYVLLQDLGLTGLRESEAQFRKYL